MVESGWSLETLKEHFDQRFRELATAVEKSERAAEKRFESVNEFRGQAADRDKFFATKAEIYPRLDAINERIRGLVERSDKQDGRGVGMSTLWGWIAGGIGIFIGLVAVFLRGK